MPVDRWWLIPLAVAGVGGIALSVVAAQLDRQVRRLEQAMRPLRIRHRRSRGPS